MKPAQAAGMEQSIWTVAEGKNDEGERLPCWNSAGRFSAEVVQVQIVRISKMLRKLEQNPNEEFVISDDNSAKTLLFELGLIDKLSNDVSGIATPTQAVTGQCKTHYILAVFFSGRPKAEDNGYIVFAFPKSQFSGGKAMRLVGDILKRYGGDLFSAKLLSETSWEN